MNGPLHVNSIAQQVAKSGAQSVPAVAKVVAVDPQTKAVVDDLFERLKAHFPAWRQAWPSELELHAAKREWLAEFMRAGIRSLEQIQAGLRFAARHPSAWVPAPGMFVDWCFSPEAFGLPGLEKAYRIAMRNTHPAQAGIARWPHPAVYHAAVAAGYLNLQRLERKVSMELFKRKYLEQCRRIGQGEELPPAPVAELPAPMGRGSAVVAARALAEIRACIGGIRSGR
ncbi:replication protein P [Pseudomonas sp. TTU2014-080ASC]|uniref:replication protein P n=1 Tax=Pseudomonas sp. TTU2014-080ASC TaxID=1729724 RepID=UPI0007183DDA|nr:replication protein P [Pseudomonas sp. TTU2014-080ASC]KRW62354.1 hypothetical protein AO726_02725 [Pseudomonas sp. TTU2014-080ASC]